MFGYGMHVIYIIGTPLNIKWLTIIYCDIIIWYMEIAKIEGQQLQSETKYTHIILSIKGMHLVLLGDIWKKSVTIRWTQMKIDE